MPKPNYHPKLLIPQIALLQRVRAVGATREPVRRVLVHVSALRVHFDGFQSIHDLDKGISGDDELIRVLVSDEIPPVVHQVERRRLQGRSAGTTQHRAAQAAQQAACSWFVKSSTSEQSFSAHAGPEFLSSPSLFESAQVCTSLVGFLGHPRMLRTSHSCK